MSLLAKSPRAAASSDDPEAAGPVVPFTILTGWLGAGKTTVLNRLLTHRPQRRIAVLVNELGRISIDTQLILRRGSDVLELAGGCICCSVDLKNDLWDGIADIIQRSSPDHVVLETTGIAEPAAILDGLVRLPDAMRKRVAPAGVICVVDAAHAATAGGALTTRDEAREQVLAADRLLLSKLDIATPEQVLACHRRLDELNPAAERASFPLDDAGSVALAEWILTPRLAAGAAPGEGEPAAPEHEHGHGHGHHHHHGQLVAAAFVDEAPLVRERLLAVVEALLPRLVRVKGFVHLAAEAGEPSGERGFLELAGARLELRRAEPWPEGTPRKSELVFIGDDLDEAALLRALWACRAGG